MGDGKRRRESERAISEQGQGPRTESVAEESAAPGERPEEAAGTDTDGQTGGEDTGNDVEEEEEYVELAVMSNADYLAQGAFDDDEWPESGAQGPTESRERFVGDARNLARARGRVQLGIPRYRQGRR